MLDPENAKESILDSLEWTEHELREYLREILTIYVTTKMTFDPYTISIDLRKIVIIAVLSVPGPEQPEACAEIRKRLDGMRIWMAFDNNSSETLMRLVFEANRFKSNLSATGEEDPSSLPKWARSPGPSC
jgi:hypothetical protein